MTSDTEESGTEFTDQTERKPCENNVATWATPSPLMSDFVGVPTYVDWDGSIYFHQVHDS